MFDVSYCDRVIVIVLSTRKDAAMLLLNTCWYVEKTDTQEQQVHRMQDAAYDKIRQDTGYSVPYSTRY